MYNFCIKHNITHRKFGFIFLLICSTIFYFNFIVPVLAIYNHQPSSHFDYKGALISVAGILYSLILLVLGERHDPLFGHFCRPNTKAKILAGLLVIPAYFATEALDDFIVEHGYVVEYSK